MRLVIAGGPRTVVVATAAGLSSTTRPAAIRPWDFHFLSFRHHYRIRATKGRRKRSKGREFSTSAACLSPSTRPHDPVIQNAAPPPPPLSSFSSSSAPAMPKESGGIGILPPTDLTSPVENSNIGNNAGNNVILPLHPSPPSSLSRDIKQQDQDREQTSTSASDSSQTPPGASQSVMHATATAAAEAAEVGKQPPQPQPQTQPSSSATTSRSFRQIIQSSAIGRAADFYSRIQGRRPYWTQLWCTLFIYLCGDLSAQLFVGDAGGKAKDKDNDMEKKANKKNGEQERGMGDEVEKEGVMARYDPLRTVRHMTVGALAAVPGYKWFMYLHNNFNFRSKPRFVSIITKVAINQVCFTPIFNTYFFCMQSLLAGTSLTETWERLKLALPTSIVNSAKLWPAVTAFMFMYVDPQFRNIFAGAIAVGWQTYLSWLNQKAAKEVEAAEAAQVQAQAVEVEGLRQDGGGVGVVASVAATS
ncbi:conserved hypothetical protein [Histoplasma capsulatum G186AR]|uniref:Integral membrane protein n=2 Tax=Ajellomyces capsulatus TaxID=5037 RepID=C0NL61_AJECG|nr:uncharacterized protein HCBG_03891 [Histoplasma capsulatum G186AR]EEH08602.1 conserved hypothetical protein [Histoplasma capsulatum G186AR]KAG5299076.1 integral membrane protein [Histoplasma capsulatum]QSS68304.1 integral membrane protein [Histoplasma capsulatum G186AR]